MARTSQIVMGVIALASALLLGPQVARSAPPLLPLRGIDAPTVLALRDQARHADMKLRFAQSWDRQSFKRLNHLRTIVIDPGHGGENQGALGVAEIHEKFLTLELAYALREHLQREYPATRIVMTRYWDRQLALSDRIHMANKIGADLFLSLHYNSAAHERAVGVETYFLATDQVTPALKPTQGQPLASTAHTTTGMLEEDKSKPVQGTYNDAMLKLQRDLKRMDQHANSGLLAETIQHALVKQLKAIDRGVKQANFGVLRGALMPAVVVEAGFVSNPKEGKQLIQERHRDKVVDALTKAIVEFDEAMTTKYARAKDETPANQP